ncbi:MAG: aldo/keto reductase [Proteobacteria bacterium]|nr:aldo/keto reductase [Pseudomonadota bacterium]
MQRRRLGRSSLTTAPLVFGGNVFGWTADLRTSHALLDAYIGAGFDMIDTADVYSTWAPGNHGGESETIIGDWLAQRGGRERVVIATKVGNPMGDDRKGLRAAYIVRAAEASLERLRTDYIDLYFAHNPDPSVPLDETLEAFGRLVAAGKVRALGASNHSAAQLADALATSQRLGLPRYEVIQPLYNLYDRDVFEGPLADLCIAEDIGVVCYYALASGFLTGKYRTDASIAASSRARSNAKYLNPRGLRILDALDAVAAALGARPGQVAIAWLLTRPGVTAPIASATTLAQLDELLGATRLTLDRAMLETLERASAPAQG